MTYRKPAGLLLVIAAIAVALGYQSLASAAAPIAVRRSKHRDAPPGPLGEADGTAPMYTDPTDDPRTQR